jgi:hypothetical protein
MRLYVSLFSLVLCLHSAAQNPAKYADIERKPVNYILPLGKNGLKETYFMMNARVKITRWEKKATVRVSFDFIAGTAENNDPPFKFMYQYNNKYYGDQHLGMESFNGIRVDRDFTKFKVEVMGYGKSKILEVPRGEYFFLEFDNIDIDANKFSVFFPEVTYIAFTGTRHIEEKIRNLEKSNGQSKSSVKKPELESNTGTNQNNTKNQATKSQNNNTKQVEEKNNSKGNSLSSSNKSKNESPVNKNSNQDKSTYEQSAQNESGNVIKNNNINLDGASTFFTDKEGNHYQKIDKHSFKKITKEEYDAGRAAIRENRIQSEQTKKNNDKRFADSVKQSIQQSSDRLFEETQKAHARIERDGNLMMANYYAAKEVGNIKNEMQSASKLKNRYESVEELENDFKAKMGSLSGSSERLASAQNQKLQSNYEYQFRDADATGRAMGEAVVGLGNMFNSISAEKEAEKARRELKEAREEALRKMRVQQKENMLNLRKKLFTTFSNGGLPLSSHRVASKVVYLFSYSFNTDQIENEKPTIKITNVFPIAKTNDDTWPFQSSILNELKKVFNEQECTLFGYFADEQKINKMHASFARMAMQAGMNIQTITYKGRPLKIDGEANKQQPSTDFLGNPINKGKETETNKNARSTEKVDFFGNPIKNELQTESTDKTETSNQVDFFGNPIKN